MANENEFETIEEKQDEERRRGSDRRTGEEGISGGPGDFEEKRTGFERRSSLRRN